MEFESVSLPHTTISVVESPSAEVPQVPWIFRRSLPVLAYRLVQARAHAPKKADLNHSAEAGLGLRGGENGDAAALCLFPALCAIMIGLICLPIPVMAVFWAKAFQQDMVTFTLVDSSVNFQCAFFELGLGNGNNQLNSCGIDGFIEAPSDDFVIFDCDEVKAFAGTQQMADELCALADSDASGADIIKGRKMFIAALALALYCACCMFGGGGGSSREGAAGAKGGEGSDGPGIAILCCVLPLILTCFFLPLILALAARSTMQGTDYAISPVVDISVTNALSPSGIYDKLLVVSLLDEYVDIYYTLAFVQLAFVAAALVFGYFAFVAMKAQMK